MGSLRVKFGSEEVGNSNYIELCKVQSEPSIRFNHEDGVYYTIMMLDPDAPSAINHIYRHVLHMLTINININHKNIINQLVPFMPSDPPLNSGPHRYYICLFKQEKKLELTSIPPRLKFNANNFITEHNLKLIAYKMYKTERTKQYLSKCI